MSFPPLTQAERLSGALQHAYPKRLLSAIMFGATRVRFAPYKNWQIRWFIRKYGVDMAEAVEAEPCAYPEFNTFFTRPLRPDARPLAAGQGSIVSPADGRVLEFGDVAGGRALQVKGQEMSIPELLGGDAQMFAPFAEGSFITVYLSPRDYHRVHMPIAGRLRAMAYIPGALFSVSVKCARTIPGLFVRNERVVSFFDTPAGPLALVLVGAVFVGCIETIWAGQVRDGGRAQVSWRHYGDDVPAISLGKGQEMGRFNMGSTVIAVFGGSAVHWSPELRAGMPVTMGEQIASHPQIP